MKYRQSNMQYLVLGLAAFAAMIVAFHWAWNVVMPSLFGLPAIEFQQTIGLIVLMLVSSVLLGLHRGAHHGSVWRHRRSNWSHNHDNSEYDA